MLKRLRASTGRHRSIAAFSALVLAGALVFAAASLAAFEPTVHVIGCSNSSQIFQSYDHYSTKHVAVNSAQNGAALKEWATEGSSAWAGNAARGWPGFDARFAANGATAVWYPLCIRTGDYPTNRKAYAAFKTFVTLLRKRTSAPLYVSPTIGSQVTRLKDDDA